MSYSQIIQPNYAKGGTIKGMCLRNVAQVFGGPFSGYHPSATFEWGETIQHTDGVLPIGVAVPVWWDGVNKNGHINISMGDGRIWNDGSIVDAAEYLRTHKLLGWGETLCDKRIVQFIPDPAPTLPLDSIEEVAQKVIRGDFGNGQARVNALTAAGYDPAAVQTVVNAKLVASTVKPINDAIVNAVIHGDYGNGQARVNALTNAGYNAAEVQAAVNRRYK